MWQAQVMAARKLSKSGAKIKVGKAFYSFSVFCFLVFCFQFLFVNIILDFFGTKKIQWQCLVDRPKHNQRRQRRVITRA
jgi:uncharacterized membrane-anchored protein YitT (DUF2179 family)